MEKFKYLIIGGGAAGVSAAETIRQTDKEGTMAIVSDEPYILYSRVMLSKPNFFLGKIPFDQIYLKGKDWYEENNIQFLGGKTAVNLDGVGRVLSLSDGSKLQYEKLLVATGVKARISEVPGADKKGVHYLRTLEDGKAIMEHIKTAKNAVTVGGGFISFEMADLLKLAGLNTTMLLRESYFWEPILDEASGLMLEKAITKAGVNPVVDFGTVATSAATGNVSAKIHYGVKILKNSEIAEIAGGESVESLGLKDRTKILCDMLVCGIGVTNPIAWLKQDGVTTNRGILANEFLETNLPDVWVAGDIAEYKDVLLEENVQMGNWVNAKEQGRIAGLNMSLDKARGKQPFKFVSFYTTQGFGMSVAFVGDVSPAQDRIIIPRGSPEINSYGRIIVDKKGELVGATLINRTSELTTIAKLIENNINVSAHQSDLSDPSFDLNHFIN